VLFTKYYLDVQNKKDQSCGAHSIYGREMYAKFWLENLKGDHLEDFGKDGTAILKWTLNRVRAVFVFEEILVLFHIQEILSSNLSQ
jgi:hypothetical protein